MRRNGFFKVIIMFLAVSAGIVGGTLTLTKTPTEGVYTPVEEIQVDNVRKYANGTQIDENAEFEKYSSLESAIQDSSNQDVLEIVNDLVITQTIDVDKELTIYSPKENTKIVRADGFDGVVFNVLETGSLTLGRQLEIGNMILSGENEQTTNALITSSGTLTLNPNFTITKSSANTNGSAVNLAGGIFNLAGATIENNPSFAPENFGAVYVGGNSTANITSGQITQTAFAGDVAGVYVAKTATLNFTGGEITAPGQKVALSFEGDETTPTIASISGDAVVSSIKTDNVNLSLNGGYVTNVEISNGTLLTNDVTVNGNVNLLDNATLNAGSSMLTSVTAGDEATGVVVNVNENGIGNLNITENMQANLFANAYVYNINLLEENSTFNVMQALTTQEVMTVAPYQRTIGEEVATYQNIVDSDASVFYVKNANVENLEFMTLANKLTITSSLDLVITADVTQYDSDGTEKEPTITVTIGEQTLTQGQDYMLSGDLRATDADEYQITVQGLSYYFGKTATLTWIINPGIHEMQIVLDENTFEYTSEEITPTYTVRVGGVDLLPEEYNVISGGYATNAGEYTLSIEGLGEHADKNDTANWTITPTSNNFVITPVATTLLYDKDVQSPSFTVTYNGNTVSESNYMTSNQDEMTQIGDYVMTITGVGNFDNQTDLNWSIVANNSVLEVEFTSQSTFAYDSTQKTVTFDVKIGELTLVEGEDYEVVGDTTATQVGTYTFNVNGLSNFTGTGSASWDIEVVSGDLMVSLNSSQFDYTGQIIAPEIEVRQGGTLLTRDVDYTVSGDYQETNVGDYTITVTGIGNYSGTGTHVWQIVPNASALTVSATQDTFEYTGQVFTPEITVMCGTYTLDESEYSLSGDVSASLIDSYTISVSATGNYVGTGQLNWNIVVNTQSIDVFITPVSYSFDGSLKTPTVVASINSNTLVQDVDYTLSGDLSQSAIGMYTIQVTGAGNYSGTGSGNWEIVTNSAGMYFDFIQDTFEYNSEIQIPSFDVYSSLGDVLLTQGVDYTISYSNSSSEDAGTYTVTATGIGSYLGEEQASYYITPKDITLTWSDLIRVYDGSPLSPIVSVSEMPYPDDELTGISNDRIDVGVYNITSVIGGADASNYNFINTSFVFEITPKPVTAYWNPVGVASYLYNGAVQAPTVTSVETIHPNDLANVSFTVSGVNNSEVGSYTATATLIGDRAFNYQIETGETKEYEITSMGLNSITFVDATYNAVEQTAVVDEVMPAGATYNIISGNQQTNAGIYTITIEGTNGYTGQITGTWTINQKGVSVTWNPASPSYTYDGNAHGPVISAVDNRCAIDIANDTIDVAASGNSNTDAGTYTATASLTGVSAANYTIESGETLEYTIAQAEIMTYTFMDLTTTYNAETHSVSVTGLPSGVTVDSYEANATQYHPDGYELPSTTLSGNSFNRAGTYVVTATLDGGTNYLNSTISATLTINKYAIEFTANDKSSYYGEEIASLDWSITNGEEQGGDIEYVMTIDTDATDSSDVGTYTITVWHPGNVNYDITLVNGIYEILAVAPTLSFGQGSYSVQQGNSITINASTSSSSAISYSSSNSTVANINSSSGYTSTYYNTSFGQITITASVAASGNYSALSKTVQLTVVQTQAVNVDTAVKYSSFASAISSASGGNTVGVVASFNISSTIAIDSKTIIIRPYCSSSDVLTITRASGFTGAFFDLDRGDYTFGHASSTNGTLVFDGNRASVNAQEAIINMIYPALGSQEVTIEDNITFQNNRNISSDGGAIYNGGMDLIINGGVFDNNNTFGNGGAIYGWADINGGTFTDNSARDFGGDWYIGSNSSTSVYNATFNGGRASDVAGSIYKTGSGTLTIGSGTTIEDAGSQGEGHAIYVNDGQITINSSTIFTNNNGMEYEQGSNGVIFIKSGASVYVNGGNFNNNFSNGMYGALFTNYGTLTIAGGTFEYNTGYDAAILDNLSSGTATISGGTFRYNDCDGGVDTVISNSGDITIRGGYFRYQTRTMHANGTSNIYISGSPSIYNYIELNDCIIVVNAPMFNSVVIPISSSHPSHGLNMVQRLSSSWSISTKFTYAGGYSLTSDGNFLEIA